MTEPDLADNDLQWIGLGGGCHWCTEAVFQSLPEVLEVKQGWLRSIAPNDDWSEGVLVHFDPKTTHLSALIDVHLITHASQSMHPLRDRYRSAIYTFDDDQRCGAKRTLETLQSKFPRDLVTQVLACDGFKSSPERYCNYYATDPERPFSQKYIEPKLAMLRRRGGLNGGHETPDADR